MQAKKRKLNKSKRKAQPAGGDNGSPDDKVSALFQLLFVFMFKCCSNWLKRATFSPVHQMRAIGSMVRARMRENVVLSGA